MVKRFGSIATAPKGRPMKFLLALGLVLALAACNGGPEAAAAASDGYRQGGVVGALVATTPEALAERKRKAGLRAAYRAKVCEGFAPAGSDAHKGCVLEIAETEDRRAEIARNSSRAVTCQRFMDTVTCE